MKCIEEAIEDNNEDNDDELDYDNHDRVCLCDPTDFNAGACCCNYLGLSFDGKCRQDGYDRWLDSQNLPIAKPLVIKFKYFQQRKYSIMKKLNFQSLSVKMIYGLEVRP